MRFSIFNNSFLLLYLGAQFFIAAVMVWVAIVVFRRRGPGALIALIGGLLVAPTSLITLLPRLGVWLRFLRDPDIMMFATIANVLGQLLLLGGVLLHLMKRNSEAERIAELEAIIRDRDNTR